MSKLDRWWHKREYSADQDLSAAINGATCFSENPKAELFDVVIAMQYSETEISVVLDSKSLVRKLLPCMAIRAAKLEVTHLPRSTQKMKFVSSLWQVSIQSFRNLMVKTAEVL